MSATTLAIDAKRVYTLSTMGGMEPQPGLVAACDKTGCDGHPEVLASGQMGAWGIAVDDSSVYWTAAYGRTVMKASLTGGTVTTLVRPGGADSISVSAGRVFYASGDLMSVPVNGGTPAALFSPNKNNSVAGLTSDATNVYAFTTDGFIVEVLVRGGSALTLASDQGQGIGIAVDGTSVYWAASPRSRPGGIVKAPIGGGAVTTLVAGLTGVPSGIAVDATSVYWSNFVDGTLMKVTPK